MEFEINDFIGNICREERQYAALLYSILLKVKNNTGSTKEKEIVNYIIKDYNSIKQVFFEVAIMRDYFYTLSDDKKKEFNKALLVHCGLNTDDIDVIPDSLGSPSKGWKERQDNLTDKDKRFRLQYARYMMRAKPDLMVIYDHDKKIYVKILECKYTQEEGKYKDSDGKLTIRQEEVQADIMKFLLGETGILRFDNKPIFFIGVAEVDFEEKKQTDSKCVYYIPKDKLINLAYNK